MASALDGS